MNARTGLDGAMDVDGFLAVSREVFAPLYPYYAKRFLAQSGLTDGVCLDVGCGGGDLGLAVAARSAMFAVLLDRSPAMLAAAGRNGSERGLAGRFAVLAGDAHEPPLAEGSVDLVVSRGSLMFWADPAKAFAAIRRLLSPRGKAILGGGLGTPQMRAAICRAMAARNSRWTADAPPPPRPGTEPETHARALQAAGIRGYIIVLEDAGHWIVFGKA